MHHDRPRAKGFLATGARGRHSPTLRAASFCLLRERTAAFHQQAGG
ncbi:hypothetical protein SAMN05444002_2458 [Vannielia litorea]|uniref:Uncharacterized protein n=1 Tax=Vannielia litorea TaxID=1217970 RepID=A0A1N6GG55_9RHOB|nr:hypothetical protein SAMN05444002_2458 [Vannielia litorea]